MSCGHDGCTCPPDHTDEHQHPQQQVADLPVHVETAARGEGGCCGGGHHGDHTDDHRQGVVGVDH